MAARAEWGALETPVVCVCVCVCMCVSVCVSVLCFYRGGHSRNIWWNLQHCRFPPERQLAERHKYHY